jgi:uncharacterized protein involved in tolerance to divalent cations
MTYPIPEDEQMLVAMISNLIMTLDDYYHPNIIAGAVEDVMSSYLEFVDEYRDGE